MSSGSRSGGSGRAKRGLVAGDCWPVMSDLSGLAVRVPASGVVGSAGWNYTLPGRTGSLGLAADVALRS